MAIKDKPVNDWFRGVDNRISEQRKARMAELQAAEPVIHVLKDILERDLKQRQKAQRSKEEYDNPQWPYLQADYNGSIRELERILKMLPLAS